MKKLTKKQKNGLTQKLNMVKQNYKTLWEENQELRKAVHDAHKGLEQIEENLDTFMGVFISKLGGEVTITKEELMTKYAVVRTINEDSYTFKAEAKNEEETTTDDNC